MAQAMSQNIELGDGEVRALFFMVAIIAAGLICTILSTGSALGLAVGATLGYFGMRILRWLQRIIEGKRAG